MRPRAVVTGLGAVSCFGAGVSAFFDGLCRGTQAMRCRPGLFSVGLSALPIALVPLAKEGTDDGAALLGGTPRALLLSQLAADEALADAGWHLPERGAGGLAACRLGLCVGTTLGEKGPWLCGLREPQETPASDFGCAAPARLLARRYGPRCAETVSAACASSNAALGLALGWIRAGWCDAVLCGGVDALQPFVIAGFAALRAHAPTPCRPFDAARCGLNLGEGAAFLLLESETHALARGARIRAYLDGQGQSCDAHHMTGPDREGKGAARAMFAALADAGLSPAAVDFVSAHGTATPYNDWMEAHALAAVFGTRSMKVPVNSIKGAIGHCLGAAGALEAVMAVRILEEQLIPPTAGHERCDEQIALHIVAGAAKKQEVCSVLSTSSGFGGMNAALLFTKQGAHRLGALA